MKILIIGSEGFIGSNLVTYYRNQKGVIVYKCDIVDLNNENYFCLNSKAFDFKKIFSIEKFDFCINAAGAANVSLSLQNPTGDYCLNVTHVFEILDAIRETKNPCKFIQFSSAAVYGNPTQLPVSEIETIKPLSPYGFHKWQSELLCHEFCKIYNIPCIVLRIFSVYGAGLRKQLFWDLYQKTKIENELVIFGTGKESRDFIYIDDLMIVINEIIYHGNFKSEIYNVANNQEVFIEDAVACFLSNLNWKGNYRFSGEKREGDPINWKADIEKIKKIGYKQNVSFEKGIEMYCKWLKELK